VSDRLVNDDLYIMTANGDGERALLVRDVDADELDPAWSPDGLWIAFSSNREGPVYDLYVIRPDGSEIQRVTSREDDTRYVDWKP
jgi:Tol biopolymer transport system component